MPNNPLVDPRDALREVFGFSDYRPGQREVMSALFRHGAALAVFPTGAGKSLCYQLPATMLDGITVVVSPLIALMKDQVDFLRERGVPAARLDTSLSDAEARAVRAGLRNGMLKLLFVAPERFANEVFTEALREARVALFAVDEAHCISEWGHNFRPDYLKLARMATEVGAERILALTATATPKVVADICEGFGIPTEAAVVTGFYRPNLRLLTTPVRSADRDRELIARFRSRPPGSAIVYVTLQRTAEIVAAMLVREGFPARAYHAGMPPEMRHEVQDWWTASDDGIVAATIAFGMGIDKAAVRYVYHYNVPKSLESYSQEIGRAGRDGLPSIVEMLACPDDLPTLENFTYGDTPTTEALEALARDVVAQSGEFEVDMREWPVRYDLRELVLKTALTYLELLGVISQGTPRYAEYRLRLARPRDEVLAEFRPKAAAFIGALLDRCWKGETGRARWWRLDADRAVREMRRDRRHVIKAMDLLRERRLADVQPGDVRHSFSVVEGHGRTLAEITERLAERFVRREQQEISRLREVMDLVTQHGCQVNALVGHFGERRETPCGHCTWCETGRAQRLHRSRALLPIGTRVSRRTVVDLQAEFPAALGTARQMARFLCGLTSPATTEAGLRNDRLFGRLDGHPFADVMAWLGGVAADPEHAGRRTKRR